MKSINSLLPNSLGAWRYIATGALVSLMFVSSASAVLRSRYPEKPQPPFNGQVIIILNENSIPQSTGTHK